MENIVYSNEFRSAAAVSTVLSVVLLGGCSTLIHPLAIDWEHGARRGTVVQVYDTSRPALPLPACLARLSATDLALHRYAEIDYRHVRHLYREVGELPAGMNAMPGDAVEFLPKNCENGTLSTVVRVLPGAPS